MVVQDVNGYVRVDRDARLPSTVILVLWAPPAGGAPWLWLNREWWPAASVADRRAALNLLVLGEPLPSAWAVWGWRIGGALMDDARARLADVPVVFWRQLSEE